MHIRDHHVGDRSLRRHADDVLRCDGRRRADEVGNAAAAGDPGRAVFRRAVGQRVRLRDREDEGAAVHRDARDDDAAQGAVARDLGHAADLFQRHAGLYVDRAGFADRRPDSRAADSERGADPVPRRARRVDRAEPHDLRPLHVRARQQRGGAAAVRRERRCVEDRRLHVQRRGVRDRRAADRIAAQLRATGARAGLRARRDRGGRDRRHVAVGRRGQHRRHHHRRVHHERADQRAAHHVGRAGMADRRDGRDHHPRRLRGHPAPAPALTHARADGRKQAHRRITAGRAGISVDTNQGDAK
ncbi:hypothetical protein BLAT2472_80195 [Burkholderia latens]